MTINISLNQLANLQNETTAVTQINQNSYTIQGGFTTALNTAGDQMQGTLDMNSNQMINLPQPATANSPLRLQDLNAFTGSGTVTNIPPGGAVGDVLVKTSASSYVVGWSPNAAGVTAGTNIVLSGSSPVTIQTNTSPSFNVVTSTTENISTANVTTMSVGTVTVAGSLTATGNVTGASGNFTNFTVSNAISASTITASTITATTVTATVPAGTLSGTTLASNVVSTSIASVGTITTGVWNGTAITATSLSGATLANGILASSLTSLGTLTSLTNSGTTKLSANAIISVTSVNPDSLLTIFSNTTATTTSSPQANILHLVGTDASGVAAFMQGFGGSFGWNGSRANGTLTTPTAVSAGQGILNYACYAYNGTTYNLNGALQFVANNTQTSTDASTVFKIFNVPASSTTLTEAVRVQASGGMSIGSATGTDPGTGGLVIGGNFTATGNITSASGNIVNLTTSAPIVLPKYTVTTLPVSTTGAIAVVTDALAPTFLGALTGGGTTKSLVIYNGSAWVAA